MASKFLSLWRSIGMEPALLSYMISSFIRWPVFQSLLYEKACLDEYGGGNSTVDCSNVSALHKDQTLHEYFNHLYLASSLALMIPSMFAAALLGSLCDAWRFKLPMMIPFVGLIISDLNYVLQALFMHWNPYWLVLSDVIFGVCGGYISITSTIFSYSMRTTKLEYRSERVAALEGSIGVGSVIGSLSSGFIRRSFGYVTVFVIITLLNIVALVYIAIFAQEIHVHNPIDSQNEEDDSGGKASRILQGLGRRFRDVWKILAVERDPLVKKLTILTFLALAIELFSFSGVTDILFSFMRGRFGWNDTQYGLFNGISSIFGCFNTLIIYPLCHKVFGIANSSLAIFGVLSKIVFLIMLAAAKNEWVAYAATFPMSFNRFVATSLRSIIGLLVFDEEQGRAFSLIALVESISAICATTIFNGLYPKTLSFFDGTMFIATAVAITIPLVILVCIHPKVKKVLHENEQHGHTVSTNDEPVEPDAELL